MMDTLKMHSLDGVQRNIELIGELFPNAITEVKRNGKVEHAIDFDVLRQELSDSIVEGREERYQFTWPDKKKAMLAANAPITATLRPVVADSVGKDGTPGGFDSENLYIEGDNLEVLKLLQETYLDKVKMIYIDPPYNTGNDFVYNDEFGMRDEEWNATSGNYDEEGNQIVGRLELNTESNGRFHTDWLNMIYPRLRLAKDLLADDGVIFISIDDNEQENLKKCCDEIFGADNFIAQMVWQKRTSPDARRIVSAGHEYVLAYIKNSEIGHEVLNPLPFDDADYARYKNPDNDPNGPWISTDCTAQGGHGTKDQFYDMVTPAGRVVKLQEGLCWRYTKKRMEEEIAAGHIWFGSDGNGVPRKKTYLADRAGKTMWTWWPNTEVGHTQEATKEIATLGAIRNNGFSEANSIDEKNSSYSFKEGFDYSRLLLWFRNDCPCCDETERRGRRTPKVYHGAVAGKDGRKERSVQGRLQEHLRNRQGAYPPGWPENQRGCRFDGSG